MSRRARSRYNVICLHLLKKIVQPERDSRSWTTSIVGQRLAIAEHLDDNPGLKPQCVGLFARAYQIARKVAASKTGIDLRLSPKEPPFTIEQAQSEDY